MKHSFFYFFFSMVVGSGVVGCSMMDDDGGETPDPTGTGGNAGQGGQGAQGGQGGAPAVTVSGVVTRAVPIAEGNDGVGLLFVAAFDECRLDGTILGTAIIPDADLSADDAEVPYEIRNLTANTVYLASFLDDNGDVDPEAPLPGEGDLVYGQDAEDGMLDCIEVTLDGQDQVVDVPLDLVED
jgi:hypothetical protein